MVFAFDFLHELFAGFMHVQVFSASWLACAKQPYEKGPKSLTKKSAQRRCASCETKSTGSDRVWRFQRPWLGPGLDADGPQDLRGTLPDATGLG